MRNISIDNGATWTTPENALRHFTLTHLAEYMDDDTREAAHADLAPCSDLEFLIGYLDRAKSDLIIG